MGNRLTGVITQIKNGNDCVIVATKFFTCPPVAKSYPKNMVASTAVFLYKEIFLQYGPPKMLMSYQSSYFWNQVIKCLTTLVNVAHQVTTVYNPMCNSLTERFNCTLTESFEKNTQYQLSTCERFLPAALWNYCTKVHKMTEHCPLQPHVQSCV